MPANQLTAKEVQNAKKGKFSDGGGLYLNVDGRNNKKWTFKYTSPSGKRREMGLGTYPDISLSEARNAAQKARIKLNSKLDPIEARNQEISSLQRAAREEATNNLTFEQAAEIYFQKIKYTLKPTERGYYKWLSPLRANVFPKYGSLRLVDFDMNTIIAILSPIWLSRPSMSKKVFSRIKVILEHNEIDLKIIADAKRKLPLRPPRKSSHLKSMDWQKVPDFYNRLSDLPDTPARLCLQLVILSAVRCAEARRAEHSHFSFKDLVWTVPAEIVKGHLDATEPHLVPMNDAIVSVVKRAMNWHPVMLFPSPSNIRCISDMAMTRIMKRMGYADTVHGFRSSFRNWAAENGEDFESAEAQLHHVIGSAVTRAYLRTNLVERRRPMMARWASFVLNMNVEGNVSQFKAKKL